MSSAPVLAAVLVEKPAPVGVPTVDISQSSGTIAVASRDCVRTLRLSAAALAHSIGPGLGCERTMQPLAVQPLVAIAGDTTRILDRGLAAVKSNVKCMRCVRVRARAFLPPIAR